MPPHREPDREPKQEQDHDQVNDLMSRCDSLSPRYRGADFGADAPGMNF